MSSGRRYIDRFQSDEEVAQLPQQRPNLEGESLPFPLVDIYIELSMAGFAFGIDVHIKLRYEINLYGGSLFPSEIFGTDFSRLRSSE